jgi:hypothetical protein
MPRPASSKSRLTRTEAALGKTGLAIRLDEGDEPPLFAHVGSLAHGELRTRLQPEAVAAVFISEGSDGAAGADEMAVVYGLTPAETRLLESLLAGRSLAETAAARGVAMTTAKTHLDNTFPENRRQPPGGTDAVGGARRFSRAPHNARPSKSASSSTPSTIKSKVPRVGAGSTIRPSPHSSFRDT